MKKIEEIRERLEEIIKIYMADQGVPGLSVGIVVNGGEIYTKGFGTKNISTGEPVTGKSLFHMASVSKTFVATSIMQLMEKGMLDINKPVVDYLHYFRLNDSRYKDITIQQMMSHVSGMPDIYEYGWDNPQYDDEALERFIRSLSDFQLMWDPGYKAAYSNIAYEVLGDMIAKVSGMSFEDYVKENILDKLNMAESNFLKEKVSKELLVSPHVLGDSFDTEVSSIFPYNRMHAPSSTLYSSAFEMCNYASCYINKGSYNGKNIIKPESYENMLTPRTRADWRESEIGLCWFIEDFKGGKLITHNGGDTGFGSNLTIVPESGIGVVTMCNCDYASMANLSKTILELIWEGEAKPVKVMISYKLMKTILEQGIKAAKDEFIDIKANNQDKYSINENNFNALGYCLMNIGRVDDAIEMMSLALDEYPKSSNLYDSTGEFYLTKGDNELAAINYRKSLELNPGNQNAVEVLKKIGQ